MSFQVIKATRQKRPVKLAISGPSGSGKTMSSLLVAYGIVGDWNKVGVIDTEGESSRLYVGQKVGGVQIGQFLFIDMKPPYRPERFIEAMDAMFAAGAEIVIIDSLSHEWMGEGGIMDDYNKMGGQYRFWAKLTPRHTLLMQYIINAKRHIIATFRAKEEYAQSSSEGQSKIEKLGMAPVTREGTIFEFTTGLNMNMQNVAEASKDRTGIFPLGQTFKLSAETGRTLAEWADNGEELEPEVNPFNLVMAATTEVKLKEIYAEYSSIPGLREAVINRRAELASIAEEAEQEETVA